MLSAEIIENSAQAGAVNETYGTQKKTGNYGKTVGKPQLSEKASEYYKELKKKFSNMDFILVSNDMKEVAKSQAASYANPAKMVVLIDEEKLERMATDENYRKQYEGIISSAGTKLPELKASLGNNSNVKGFGMQVNDGGTASFFAVVDKSLAAQKTRIEKNAAKKAEQKKATEKKNAKKAAKEKEAEKRTEKAEAKEELVTVTASSIEELVKKIDDLSYYTRSNSIQTEEEKAVGQHIDFKW